MATYMSIAEAAKQLDSIPRRISDFFYSRQIDDSRCLHIGGQRAIPVDMLPELKLALGANRRRKQAARELATATV